MYKFLSYVTATLTFDNQNVFLISKSFFVKKKSQTVVILRNLKTWHVYILLHISTWIFFFILLINLLNIAFFLFGHLE